MNAIRQAVRGVGIAVRARPGLFLEVALGVFALYLVLPVALLSVVRKPVDFFTFNPWLRRLPGYLASPGVPLQRKLEFLPGLVLFWLSADGPVGELEWGFAVDVTDLARFGAMALLFGCYFALWAYRRGDPAGRQPRIGRPGGPGGVIGALTGVLGFSTGPCSVVGCGAPVIPVVGLAFAGLSSGALALMAGVSRVAAAVVLVAAVGAVGYLGWRVGVSRGSSS